MDKIYTYLMITFMVSLFLGFAGYGSEINTYNMINSVAENGLLSSTLWIAIAAALTILLAATGYQAAIAGNASAAITTATSGLALYTLITFMTDIWKVYQLMETTCSSGALCSVPQYISMAILIPLGLGFAWSLGQYVLGGGD